MTNNTSQRFALLFLVLALTEVFSLASLVPLDATFASWVELHRSCTLDYFAVLLKNAPLFLLFALGGLALLWLTIRQRWSEAWHALLVVVAGGFLSELLKTGFERARPSVLPAVIEGNSFPSGHVTGALLVAGTLGFVLAQERWATWIKVGWLSLLASLVSVVTWHRLYLAHHWLSDIFGSILLVSAWLCFALPRPALSRLSSRPILVCVGLLVTYQVFFFFPQTRIHLPSGHVLSETPDFDFFFGTEVQSELLGAWGERTADSPGSITWLREGEASVEVPLPQSQAYTLKLVVRPFVQSKAFACFPLEVLVNRTQVAQLLLYRGWREYTLHLDPQWVVPGRNFITFRAGVAFPARFPDQDLVAFRHLRLFPKKD